MSQKTKIGVLVSGSGTNLQAIIDSNIPSCEITIVISNKPDAYALNRAEKHNIPAEVINHKDYDSREAFERQLIKCLDEKGVELIVLAGFMRVLTPFFVKHYKHRIINIHPALLPSFPGVNSTKQAFDYGVRFTGCTVHFVDDGVDTGPIILQSVVEITPDDTEDTLLEKIHEQEHIVFPKAVRLFCDGKISIDGRKVIISD
ncbi:MAG TPA: phosphoribosylglycinamide formyltransferase [Thermodesulfobacteriota bacterium]|nr:phosphoribosylglycinamide formyltransferase [Thermodesulfobacteriota bacterium]